MSEEIEPPGGGESVVRRRLIQIMLGGGIAASIASFLYPALKFMLPPRTGELDTGTVVAAKVAEVKLNSGKIFKFGNKPGLLVHTSTGEWKAFSAVCTHLNCTVQFREDQQRIWCACHNGFYDLNGKNVSGPPPRPLEEFQVHIRGDEVVVTRRA